MEDPAWKKIKLSLERPYTDDRGEHIPSLLDITPEGEHIYEPREDWATQLGAKFRRIFVERGADFFDRSMLDTEDFNRSPGGDGNTGKVDQTSDEDTEEVDVGQKFMTPEMLFKMRMEIIPRLHIAMGEMSHAHDLLSLLLSTSNLNEPSTVASLPSGSLTSTTVTKPPHIPSVQAFDAQLVTGGKDDALRKASGVLKTAAESMERGTLRSERYWSDALKIRRGNWGLIPAPLPFGSAIGKGADRTSKDFLISFGLEESPPLILRQAVGQMSNYTTESTEVPVIFPQRRRTRLRVLLRKTDDTGESASHYNTLEHEDESSLDDAIRGAQREVVEQEIFGELVKEAGNLPTAAARVSERLIAIEAAQGIELQFELIDSDLVETLDADLHKENGGAAVCDLIYASLHVLLLRAHACAKSLRLGSSSVFKTSGVLRPSAPPLILNPIIDLLQYHVFCDRVKGVLSKMVQALATAGVAATLRFDPMGESGVQVVNSLIDDVKGKASGEAVLRIDDRQSIRFTFVSPSALTAHLPQATIPVASIPQLYQLLIDEVERGLLGRICDIGTDTCEVFNGSWFVDEMMCRSVGRWEGCILNFRVVCAEDFTVDSIAKRFDNNDGASASMTTRYSARSNMAIDLFLWVRQIIEDTLAR